MYIPKYFKLHEYFSRDFYTNHRYDGRKLRQMLWLIDDRVLWTNDKLREKYGTVHINNWFWGGGNENRGYRTPDCAVGVEWSQHKFGRASDLIFNEVTAEEVRQDILSDPFCQDFEHISCIEMGVSWLHWDCRNWNKSKNGILQIKP